MWLRLHKTYRSLQLALQESSDFNRKDTHSCHITQACQVMQSAGAVSI